MSKTSQTLSVGCAGIVVADTYCGPMNSIPQEGEVLVIDDILSNVGGCAANVASALAKQNMPAAVAGCVGHDHSARIVLGALEDRGVDCSQIRQVDNYSTSQTMILVVKGQDRRFVHVLGANQDFSVDQIDRQWIAGLRCFYVGGLLLMPNFLCEQLADLLKYCQTQNVLTVLDVVVPQGLQNFAGLEACLPWVDYFLPNDDEASRISGKTDPVDQALYFRSMGARTIVITRGSEGALAVRENELWRVPAFPVDAVDLTGCGDAFAAGLITSILRDRELPQTLAYASILGSSCSRAIGCYDSVLTATQAEAFIRQNQVKFDHTII